MNSIQAKNIRITDYLSALGYQPERIQQENYWYHSPFRNEKTTSFKVNNQINAWYDYGLGTGGNILDLVMKLHQLNTITEALHHLEAQTPVSTHILSSFRQQKEESIPQITLLKVLPLTNRSLLNYVLERKINPDIAKRHCKEIYYAINNKTYFAIGFKNDTGGYELRNKYFKGCTSKSPTIQNTGNSTCLVFEGFMDYLSYLTLHKLPVLKTENAVILNSVTNLPKALEFIKSHADIGTYLDNDDTGKKATQFLQAECKNVIDNSALYSKYKDLNEYLCNSDLVQFNSNIRRLKR